ncbi:alcohol dehydrogenase catalytic domain-containing protein [Levilactobacillus bambusae]|uniref:NADPH:quinone reductase n=1 Tax=Levilactobacillus bambusae TaxID=2024736 RepID=A0A2V1N2A2_9LACO|nr:NADPH:quinone reductase [Levilactobacillus bambusae]PWG00416.1 NADPH:quinone reductase [Levilactobacillus bambusae]
MQSIIQTNFTGIDGLELVSMPQPTLTDDGVLIQMQTLPVVPTDWKRESNSHATNEQAAQLPRVIGIGGVGTIIQVGKNRDQALLNQRVLVMNPAGSYSEIILSENPDFIFPLPDTVDDASAAALTAGPGTALALKHEIDQSSADNIIITGANSVIGLYLIQLLGEPNQTLWPIVSPQSQAYFHRQLPGQPAYQVEDLPQLSGYSLIIDIAGSRPLIDQLLSRCPNPSLISIVLMAYEGPEPFKFVHEEFDADQYRQFITQLATQKLWAPIDRTFPVQDIKQAQHYAKDSHSRGRVLVSF